MKIQNSNHFGRLVAGGLIIVSVPLLLLVLLSGAMTANAGTVGTVLIVGVPLVLLGVGLYFLVQRPE